MASIGDTTAWTQLLGLEPIRALIVIPCSARKLAGGVLTSGPAIIDALPTLAAEPMARRADVARQARLDASVLRPAWLRYIGGFYRAAYDALLDATQRNAHLVILSGGYGLVDAREPIGDYEAPLTMSWWTITCWGAAS